MTKTDNAAQLELARQFIANLQDLLQCSSMEYFTLPSVERGKAQAIVEQFTRLADKEQKQRDAGKLGKDAGILGGAPKGNQNAKKQKP